MHERKRMQVLAGRLAWAATAAAIGVAFAAGTIFGLTGPLHLAGGAGEGAARTDTAEGLDVRLAGVIPPEDNYVDVFHVEKRIHFPATGYATGGGLADCRDGENGEHGLVVDAEVSTTPDLRVVEDGPSTGWNGRGGPGWVGSIERIAPASGPSEIVVRLTCITNRNYSELPLPTPSA